MTIAPRPPSHGPTRTWPRFWWHTGDWAAVVVVSALSAATMAVAHQVTSLTWVAIVLGMVAAMMVQVACASVMGLLLGSIETQVPAMLSGMVASMGVCAAAVLTHVQAIDAMAIGAVLGLAVLLMLDRHRRACESGVLFARELS